MARFADGVVLACKTFAAVSAARDKRRLGALHRDCSLTDFFVFGFEQITTQCIQTDGFGFDLPQAAATDYRSPLCGPIHARCVTGTKYAAAFPRRAMFLSGHHKTSPAHPRVFELLFKTREQSSRLTNMPKDTKLM